MTYTALEMPKAGDRVVVGMSGGVDSTLTSMLLKERGCTVTGVTMSTLDKNLELPELKSHRHTSCFDPNKDDDIAACKKFCAEHDIPYHVINVQDAYKKEVLEYFKSEYRAGRTPNPCIRCNELVKFGALIEGVKSLNIEFDYFCTGHYAKIVVPDENIWNVSAGGKDFSVAENSFAGDLSLRPAMVCAASDVTKDQTYFLYRVSSDTLKKVRFPLAEFTKKQVFEMARERGLAAAEKEESQDFMPAEYFDAVFSDKPSVPGDIIDLDGKVLGKHRGIEHYTVGQRRGLGVSANVPLYVHSIDAEQNIVVLCRDDELFSGALVADDFIWAGGATPPEDALPFEAMVKIRLASQPVKARIERYAKNSTENSDKNLTGTAWLVTFEKPQRAVSPGQSAVLYKDGAIIGGGVIRFTVNN